MILTYKHDLDKIKMYHRAKYLHQRSFCSKAIVRIHSRPTLHYKLVSWEFNVPFQHKYGNTLHYKVTKAVGNNNGKVRSLWKGLQCSDHFHVDALVPILHTYIHTYIHKSFLYSAYKFNRVTMRLTLMMLISHITNSHKITADKCRLKL